MPNSFEKSAAILIFDRQSLFRESLRNYLLASGFTNICTALSIQAVLAKFRQERFALILLGVSVPMAPVLRLAKVAQLRQPAAKVLLLLAASEQCCLSDAPALVLLKEYVYANLLDLITNDSP